MVSALETVISKTAFNVGFQFQLAALQRGVRPAGQDPPLLTRIKSDR
jgi:hypothetical protein